MVLSGHCMIVYGQTIILQNNPEAKHIRYDVLKIPALDPETDESNFDYDYGVGFSTKYYRTIRSKFEENDDMAGWLAQYQQEPIERDGALFNAQHMNFIMDNFQMKNH